jgi:EAL domain-containing protein (putative c-di-GMP-specific phosphodiesterase class I)
MKKIKRSDVKVHEASLTPYHMHMKKIKDYLVRNTNLGIILVDFSNINRIEFEYGKKIYNDILDDFKNIVMRMKSRQIRKDDIITLNHVYGDQFYIFLSKKRTEKKFFYQDLENVSDRLTRFLNDEIFRIIYPYLKKCPRINVGYAFIIYNPLIEEERLINKLIEDSKIMVKYQEFKNLIKYKERLQEIIIREDISTIFQPIINMHNKQILGYEALSRGPKDTEFENPYSLFNIAEDTGLLFELDSLCRRKALINAKGLKNGLNLFVNILPTSIHDPEFKGRYLNNFLKDLKLAPKRIVLEVSEREVIENFKIFRDASKYYSNLGFAIAIDDTGTGYSNLQSLLNLKFEYIKIDISMIHQIDKNPVKKELVKAINQVGKNINATVIAEGIETKEEYKTLLDMGLVYGQGFLFARPGSAFPEVSCGHL